VPLNNFVEGIEGMHEDVYSRQPVFCLRHEAGVYKAGKSN
jgi:hypothetical protein